MAEQDEEFRASSYTPEEYEGAIHAALADQNMPAVAKLLELFVRGHPKEGLKMHDEIQEALTIARFLRPT